MSLDNFNQYCFDEQQVLGEILFKEYIETMSKYEFDIEFMFQDMGIENTLQYFIDLIEKAPSFIPAYDYLIACFLLLEDSKEEISNVAFSGAIEVLQIFKSQKSKKPLIVEWLFIENRPLLRTIYNHAMDLWENELQLEAKELFELLITINPLDNQGARYNYLATSLDFTYKQFFKRFTDANGYFKPNLDKWFKENEGKNLCLIGRNTRIEKLYPELSDGSDSGMDFFS